MSNILTLDVQYVYKNPVNKRNIHSVLRLFIGFAMADFRD